MKLAHIGLMLGASVLQLTGAAAQQSAAMTSDVARMVRAAHNVDRLMPWSEPVAEIDAVVRHGKAVVPLLIVLLPDNPDDPGLAYDQWDERKILAGQQFDWIVEQQAAVALCRIFQVSVLGSCPMYSNRAMPEQNRSVKVFWLKTIADSN